MSFRYRVGIDTLNYIEHYEWITPFRDISIKDIFTQFEPLNTLIRSIAKNISSDFVIYQILHVVILNTLIARFILRNTRHILWALFFYFILAALYFNTEIMRESLAVAVFINGYKYIEKKQWLKYYLCAFIALGFHTSALIVFIVPLIRWVRFNAIFVVITVCSCLFLVKFNDTLTLLALYLSPEAALKLGYYLEADGFNINGIIVLLAGNTFFPLVAMIGSKLLKIDFKYENMVVVGIILGVCSAIQNIIFGRLTNYFIFFYIILFAEVLPVLFKSYLRQVGACAMCAFLFVTMYVNYFIDIDSTPSVTRQYTRWYPYSSIISKEKSQIREFRWLQKF